MSDETSQYFDEDPSVESKPVTYSKIICGDEYEFKSDRGVFAKGSLDKATEVLLKEFDEHYSGDPKNIADVGCGYGPIICFAAKKFEDATLLGVDPNERARKLTEFNYDKNIGDKRLSVISPNGIDEQKFDLIISNPPIRVGKVALYELLEIWSSKLNNKGEMWLVMSKNLGADSCAKFLETTCKLSVTRIASKKGFRVLKCAKV